MNEAAWDAGIQAASQFSDAQAQAAVLIDSRKNFSARPEPSGSLG